MLIVPSVPVGILDARDVVALDSETGRHNTEALASKVKEQLEVVVVRTVIRACC